MAEDLHTALIDTGEAEETLRMPGPSHATAASKATHPAMRVGRPLGQPTVDRQAVKPAMHWALPTGLSLLATSAIIQRHGWWFTMACGALILGFIGWALDPMALSRVIGSASFPASSPTAAIEVSATTVGKVFRDRMQDGSPGPAMVIIPAGLFQMGGAAGRDDERQHLVRIERAFALGKHEVTFAEYDRFATATGREKPSDSGWGRGERPVINVSWEDAVTYAAWLSEQTGHRYRLPTEAEWEYAARAGTATARYWGDRPNHVCRYANGHDEASKKVNKFRWTHHECHDGFAQTAPVGQFQANAFGLHDVLGNVGEWTCSDYDEDYQGAEQVCADKDPSSVLRVIRGGSWCYGPRDLRTAVRVWNLPNFRDFDVGFRVARQL